MPSGPGGFRHEALLHAGTEGFLEGAVPFVREGLERGERVMIAVTQSKAELLRDALGARDAATVRFAEIEILGANPGRIIPAWGDFLDDRRGPARGIGEPVWPGRTPAELTECHRQEELLNLAFADTPEFRLLCPYDIDGLRSDVVEEARRTHPLVVEDGVARVSDCRALDAIAAPFDEPLPDPPAWAEEIAFDVDTLARLRRMVERRAAMAGIAPPRSEDLVLAVNEITTNSVRHGGGRGTLAAWFEDDALVFEVRDAGRIEQPLAGRRRPAPGQLGGYGLWLAHQICDLVQVRTFCAGNVVRLHMRVAPSGSGAKGCAPCLPPTT